MRLNLTRPPAAPAATLSDVLGLIIDLVRGIQAEQRRQGAELAEIRRLLERGRGARDGADVAVMMAIAAIEIRSYTAGQVMAHAAADNTLRDALTAADITTARELGWLFRRLEGSPLAGLTVERVSATHAGIEWRVRLI